MKDRESATTNLKKTMAGLNATLRHCHNLYNKMDREKIIQGFVRLSTLGVPDCAEESCPFWRVCVDGEGCYFDMFPSVLTLLKEQEAVTIKKTKEHGFGVYGGICPKCQNWIQSAHSFCGFCGQAVKWE